MPLEIVQLRPSEGTLVEQLPVLGDDEHRAGNRVLDGGRDERVRRRQSAREAIALRLRLRAGGTTEEKKKEEAFHEPQNAAWGLARKPRASAEKVERRDPPAPLRSASPPATCRRSPRAASPASSPP